jgi:hypothetical protein
MIDGVVRTPCAALSRPFTASKVNARSLRGPDGREILQPLHFTEGHRQIEQECREWFR